MAAIFYEDPTPNGVSSYLIWFLQKYQPIWVDECGRIVDGWIKDLEKVFCGEIRDIDSNK